MAWTLTLPAAACMAALAWTLTQAPGGGLTGTLVLFVAASLTALLALGLRLRAQVMPAAGS